jgi:hypothetical protein
MAPKEGRILVQAFKRMSLLQIMQPWVVAAECLLFSAA